jgi:hypothetical protein
MSTKPVGFDVHGLDSYLPPGPRVPARSPGSRPGGTRAFRTPQFPTEEHEPVGPDAIARDVSVDLVGRPTVDLLRTDSALCR